MKAGNTKEITMNILKQKNVLVALLFLLFGFMTIISGGRSLFTESGVATRGNIVPVVLWFNFLAGFFYLLAGILTFRLKACAKKIAVILAILNIIVLSYLAIHVYQGGLYENKTIMAMTFRTFFWIFFAVYLRKSDMFKKWEAVASH